MTTFEIPISDLRENPRNPRKDMGDLTELTNSVKSNGIRQNLIVTPILDDDGEETDTYRIIAGHRRFAAAKKANLITVPCSIARDMDEADEMMAMLEENMQRSNLTYMEEAQGVQMCLDLGIPMEKIERRTGLSEQTLKHRAEIAKLTPEIVEEKSEAFQLNLKALYSLEKIKDPKKRDEVLKKAGGNDNLVFLADQAAKDEVYAERRDAIVEYLEHEGMFKAPKDANQWGSEWLGLGSIDYSQPDCGKTARENVERIKEEMEIDPMSNDTEVVYFLPNYGTIIYIKKKKEYEVDDEDETGTEGTEPVESKVQKRKRIRESLDDIWRDVPKGIREFARDIIEGKYTCSKLPFAGEALQRVTERAWKWLLKEQVFLDDEAVTSIWFEEPDLVDPDDEEEVKRIQDRCKDMSMPMQLVAIAAGCANRNKPFDYNGSYATESAEHIRDLIQIFKEFGYSLFNKEAREVLDGTHPIYEEADE